MPFTRDEVDDALSLIRRRAIDAGDFQACHAIAHVEAALFGYDPDCGPDCPL